ncbi:hypothetical protein GCM10022224_017280 [Nonomuraea antimicrobica]|uniref:Transposase, Mutator family n=1 Tax=Nonomuraea antimicrobica TaxID=561173 RepID=A0ABP7BDK6_9ACTN
MAVNGIVPAAGDYLEDTLAAASPDLLRTMIREFAQRMMDAEVEQLCGAGYGEVSSERVNTAMATAPAHGTPAPGALNWPCPGYGRAPTSRTSCWTSDAGPSGR